MTLVFATNNMHKLEEVSKILPSTCRLLTLRQIGFTDEIDETGQTLEDNSLLKARAVWDYLQTHPQTETIDGVFADDTGLEIPVLHNQPGVRTARWAGDEHNDAANRQKALRLLQDKDDRSARFRTVITLITAKDNTGSETSPIAAQVEGRVEGRMAEEERGEGGFGYDSLFIPDGYEKTFAELPAETKNSISHRARAVQQLSLLLK
jgi:XTP/dITP diphosphohydrolase